MRRTILVGVVALAAIAASARVSGAQEEFASGSAFERAQIQKAADDLDAQLQRAAAALKSGGQRTRDLPPASAPGQEDVDEVNVTADGAGDRIVNGALTARYPSIGAVLKMEDGKLGSWCTGTLIGCRTFVTAQHCVEDDPTPGPYRVFFQHAGLFGVTKVERHVPFNFPFGDLAVFTLDRDAQGIRPTGVYTGGAIPDGSSGKIVGFGRTGGVEYDYGLKRVGTIKTGPCRPDEQGCVCWNYNATVSAPGENSNTCNADSGGPLLVASGSTRLLAGVTSGGSRSSCLSGDHSYDVDVRQFADWIKTQAGTDLSGAECAALPRIGADKTKYFATAIDLAPGQGKNFKFAVPGGVSLVRVTMNGEDKAGANGKPITNFDLYVKRGSAATIDNADCIQNDSSQVGACEFTNPAAGDYFVRVEEKGSAAGSAQAVVSMFLQP